MSSIIDIIKNFGSLGGFGGIVFTVNPLQILTFENARHEASVNYVKHEIIGDLPKLEFTGPNLDELSLTLKLSSYFGFNPAEILARLYEYMYEGYIYDLFIGTTSLGEFVINKVGREYKKVDSFGNIVEMSVDVEFLEYN